MSSTHTATTTVIVTASDAKKQVRLLSVDLCKRVGCRTKPKSFQWCSSASGLFCKLQMPRRKRWLLSYLCCCASCWLQEAGKQAEKQNGDNSEEPKKVRHSASYTKLICVLQEKKRRKSVQWVEETVDNEHMNKKSSKSASSAFLCPLALNAPAPFAECCIYHKPRKFDESDSEESDYEAPVRFVASLAEVIVLRAGTFVS